MGFLEDALSAARQGVADVLGVGAMQDENQALRETLIEASADARMIARRAEDIGWTSLSGSSSGAYYFDPDNKMRGDQIRRAHLYYFNDPVSRRTIDLTTFYVLGKGIPMPKYRQPVDPSQRPADPSQNASSQAQPQDESSSSGNAHGDPDDVKTLGQLAIEAFWRHPENEVSFTGFDAQYYTLLEEQLQGQKFFTLHPAGGTIDPRTGEITPIQVPAGQTTLLVADVPENEMVDIIPHPQKRKIPAFYKRQYQTRVYDGASGTWNNDGGVTTRYYRDWRFRTPIPDDTPDWKPPPAEQIVNDVYIYHDVLNKTSEMRFGLTTMNSYLMWASALNTYMGSRMSMVQALAQLALRVKAKGGPVAVSQVRSALSDISRLAGNIEGAGGLSYTRADQGRTKIAVENQGAEMQPMINDTGSGNAAGDIAALQGQIAAGAGIGAHHIGNAAGGTLASTTSIDGPTSKLVDFYQERTETIYRKIVGFALALAGLDPSRIEVQMPPVLQRDVAQVAGSMAALIPVLDPHGENRALYRFVFGEILDAMGKVNTPELLNQIFGSQWRTPFETGQELQQQQAELAQAAAAGNVPLNGGRPNAGGAAQSAQVNLRNAGTARTVRHGRAGPDVPGGAGNAVRASQDRAAVRQQRGVRESAADELLEALAQDGEASDDLVTDALAEFDERIGADHGEPA